MKRLSMVLLALAMTALSSTAVAASTDVAAKIEAQGLVLTLAGIFFGGMLVSLTPCVYPMIPITLSIIGARSAESKPMVGFARSLVFVLGIATIYTVLGLVVALSGGTVGFLLQKPAFLVGLSVLFIIMGLSMLGMYNLQLPPSIAAKFQGGSNRGGFLGAFVLGISTGVVASPCGSPVLVSILTVAGKGGQPTLGAVMLFTYALGIGMLFLVLGTFPAFLSRAPKSGVWMEDVKKFLGLVLIIASFYYLQLALPKLVVWGALIATALMFAAIIAVHSKDRASFPKLLWAWRIAGIVLVGVAMYAGFVQVPALVEAEQVRVENLVAKAERQGNKALLAATANGTTATVAVAADGSTTGGATAAAAPTAPPDEWLDSEPEGLALAKANGWPVIIDFGAEWCAACKELEHKTFPDPEVEKVLDGFVKIKIDATTPSPETDALQEKYNSMSLPTVAFIDDEGNNLPDLTLYTFEKPQDFLQRLGKVTAN